MTVTGFIFLFIFLAIGVVGGYFHAKRQDAQALRDIEALRARLEGREKRVKEREVNLSRQLKDVDDRRRRWEGLASDVKKVEALRMLASRYDEWKAKLGDPQKDTIEVSEVAKRITDAINATGLTFEEFVEGVKPIAGTTSGGTSGGTTSSMRSSVVGSSVCATYNIDRRNK